MSHIDSLTKPETRVLLAGTELNDRAVLALAAALRQHGFETPPSGSNAPSTR